MRTRKLNFTSRFAPLVEGGFKRHTVRQMHGSEHDPLPGDTLNLFTGVGTPAARQIRSEACEYAVEITVQASAGNVHHILLGGEPMTQADAEMLAVIDGFSTAAEFVKFIDEKYSLPFSGLLIGWGVHPTFVTRH